MRYRIALLLFFIVHIHFSQDFNYSVHTLPKELVNGANAVVRLDMYKVSIHAFDHMEVQSKRVVTVLNKEGEQFIHAYAAYDKESKITALKATVYDANGFELEKFKQKDFIDQSATGGGTLYSDSRVKYLGFTPVSYPYTVVFERSYETSDTAFIPGWYFLDGYEVSMQKSKYSLDVLCDVPIRVKESNLQAFGVTSSNNAKQFRYTAENIPAIKKEPFSPSFAQFAPNIKFALEKFKLKGVVGSAKSWKEFGLWIYNDLLAGQSELDESMKIKVRKLVWGSQSTEEKVKRIYQYLQDNTRYISVQLGIGGWQPISALNVHRVKYGDCKGLTNYTMAMLRAVGITSYYTVLYAGSDKRNIDPDFPALAGNHAFLNVPLNNGRELWLECTSQEVPANFLGTFSDDRHVLKVTPSGGEIVTTKKYSPEESLQLTNAIINFGEQGSINAKVTIKSKGIQYNNKYRLPLNKENEIEEHYKDYWDYVNNVKVQSANFTNDKENIELSEVVEVSTENYISNAGDQWLFAPNMFNRNLFVPKRSRTRKNEVVIKRGFVDEDFFTINLPENVKPEQLLPKIELNTDFGEYSLEMTQAQENQILYKRRLKIIAGTFPKERYKEFREFRKKIARNDNSKIVLIKTQP
ncbi:MAG: DUF3857 domain-containing protein [Allomuricauda sp.]|nr:MAG: DUF3857 domain-containing protein [Allomuricauda sp.]